MNLQKTLLTAFVILQIALTTSLTWAQERIDNLTYARTAIKVPEGCLTKSEYQISDCNGFSAQWLYLNEEMVKQGVNEQIFLQFEQQITYETKKTIKFTSQNHKLKGSKYLLANGTTRIIGFGRVNGIPLILNLGFEKNPKNNNELTEFEKNFINL
ncbi:hypothetical protein [Sphingobacterium gobiense]|uniref:Uncharacterized protein n=1 Tax=Sphingobacterium gobiense TaxID=1382456 RepID=A0A2S9JSA3_9SPHI|nr:hypothetical protein [Sphingobacterium gobiense]PRD56021.1 hypothetical protein C5749_01655 [Sphingobacterium gobiense]